MAAPWAERLVELNSGLRGFLLTLRYGWLGAHGGIFERVVETKLKYDPVDHNHPPATFAGRGPLRQ